MLSKEISVKNESGLHARPAALLVKRASGFESSINIEYNGRKGNAKSLLRVLSLGVCKGSSIRVVADGTDEAAAITELSRLIEDMEE